MRHSALLTVVYERVCKRAFKFETEGSSFLYFFPSSTESCRMMIIIIDRSLSCDREAGLACLKRLRFRAGCFVINFIDRRRPHSLRYALRCCSRVHSPLQSAPAPPAKPKRSHFQRHARGSFDIWLVRSGFLIEAARPDARAAAAPGRRAPVRRRMVVAQIRRTLTTRST